MVSEEHCEQSGEPVREAVSLLFAATILVAAKVVVDELAIDGHRDRDYFRTTDLRCIEPALVAGRVPSVRRAVADAADSALHRGHRHERAADRLE
jgi:hypothetical protein